MAMKTRSAGLAAIFCIFAFPALADDIRIAVAGPMTGAQAASGEDMRNGASLAAGVINARGGIDGHKIVLQFEDDACSPRDAVSVANRIIANGFTMLYGHFCSPATLAAMNIYRENKIAQLTISQADQITDDKTRHDGLFRINVSNAQLSERLAREAQMNGDRIAVIYDQGAYGQSIVQGLLPHMKLRPVLQTIADGDRDFAAIATNLRRSQIDTAIVAGSADQIGMVIRQLRAQGFTGRFFTPGTGALPDVGNMAYCDADGTTAISVTVAHNVFDASPDIRTAFEAAGVPPRDSILISYAAIEALARARVRAGADLAPAIARELAKGGLPTLMGSLSWDRHGNLQNAPIALYRWGCEQGRAVLRSLPQ